MVDAINPNNYTNISNIKQNKTIEINYSLHFKANQMKIN
jgi:hypothetical protein